MLRKKYVSRFNPRELQANSYPHCGGGRGGRERGRRERGGRERRSGVAGMKASHGFRFNKTYQGYYVFF